MSEPRVEDRGFAMASARYQMYRLLDGWADRFEIASMLEGPVDGAPGIAGVFGVGLARRGVKVVTVVPSEAHAAIAQGIYEGSGTTAEVVVAGEHQLAELPRSDMVVCHLALDRVADWRAYLRGLARLARRCLVVVAPNPRQWSSAMMSRLTRNPREPEGASARGRTELLAPSLWQLGRVREHTYFDCRWWPSLDSEHVYGVGRWPYFDEGGGRAELESALARQRTPESPRARARAAHLHAFVVDVRPRTARQRRRLAQIEPQS